MGHYWADLFPKEAQRQQERHERAERVHSVIDDVPLSRFSARDLRWLVPMYQREAYYKWLHKAEEWVAKNNP